MSILQRLDPRHWGGRRVLRFLAGLALVALALAAPSAMTEPAAVPAAAPAAVGVERSVAVDATAAEEHTEASADHSAAAHGTTGAGHGTTVAAPEHRTDAGVIGTDATPPTGSTPASHGSRAPPLA